MVFKQLLKEKGWTAKLLAKEMGLKDIGLVYKWIAGDNKPNSDNMYKLQRLLNVSIAELVETFNNTIKKRGLGK